MKRLCEHEPHRRGLHIPPKQRIDVAKNASVRRVIEQVASDLPDSLNAAVEEEDDHTLIAGGCFIVAAVVLGMGVANRAACRLQVKACQVIIPRDVIALKRAKEVVIVWA